MNQCFDRLDFGISYDQWIIMEQIKNNQGINQVKLCHITSKRPASVSRILKKLAKQELVLKISNDLNKRANKIYLSHKGHDLAEKINSVYLSQLDKSFEGIYERELSLVKDVLSRVNINYQNKKKAIKIHA